MSPTQTDPCYITGSKDLMTSIIGYAERRPGFADNVETTPTTFVALKRLFSWDRFDGTFIEMACDITSSMQAAVYKRVIGTDNSFALLYTDTGSNVAFDFVVSNNTVYFSNGNVAKKWDPVNGVTNWGIAIGSGGGAALQGPNLTTSGTDVANGFTVAWANPGNITVEDGSFATATVSAGISSHFLTAATFAFAVTSGNSILGILVEIKGLQTSNNPQNLSVQLTKAGSLIGNVNIGVLPSSNGFISLGGTGDLWGTTWTSSDINAAGFGCIIFANSNDPSTAVSIDVVRITIYSTAGPAVTLGGTGLTASTGYQYVYCYGNSRTGHISSPSPPSNVVKPTNQSMNVPLIASTDAQVNQIRVFRSTDSVAAGFNAGVYFEIPTSPFANSTATIVDAAADGSLIASSVAPIAGFNDPPTPFQSPVYFAGRIWGFSDNKVFYSGLEETLLGVPEESFVSGTGGNFWNFDQPVQALAVAGTGLTQTLMVFCGGRVYGIMGNSLDTFRRFLISNRRGCRNLSCVASLGGMVAWLDSSMQVWATDGNSLQEISTDIRPDLAALTPTGASMTIHTAGKFHWLVLAFPSSMFVYDMDLEQWMPPWTVTSTYVFSGETAAGSYQLMLSNGTKALQLSTTAHNDNGATYTPVMQTSLLAVVPDFGSRFSYSAMGVYDEPSRTGYPCVVHVDTNAVSLGDVLLVNDDDPFNTSTVYTTVFANKVGPEVAYNRAQGVNIVQNIFPMTKPEARWIGLKISGLAADDALKVYGFFMAYKSLGGR